MMLVRGRSGLRGRRFLLCGVSRGTLARTRGRHTCQDGNRTDCDASHSADSSPSAQPEILSREYYSPTKAKAQRDADIAIIHHWTAQCQFPLSCVRLRKCTGQEDRSVLPRRTARAYQEDYILSTLKARLDLGEIFFAVDRLFVHFQNDVAAAQVDVFRK